MRRTRVAAVALLALAAAAVPAAAVEQTPGTTEPPELVSQRVFLDCPDTGRLANAGQVVDGPVGWSTTPPSRSFLTQQAGCFFLDATYTGEESDDPVQALTTAGTFRGLLDAFSVRLYGLSMSYQEDWDVQVGVRLDGEELVPWPTAVTIKPRSSNSGVTQTVEFGLKDLGLTDPDVDDVEHTVEVSISIDGMHRLGFTGWGAVEIPGGLHFNPQLPAPTLVPHS